MLCAKCGVEHPKKVPENLCPRCTLMAVFGEVEAGEESKKDVSEVEICGVEVLEELGEGGFGVVYLAQEECELRRKVAVKVLKPGMDSRKILRRFEIEQRALALLDHANIARILRAGKTAQGNPFFTMEYVDGGSIKDYCEGLPLEENVNVFLRVCEAVTHAHGKGVIHRDLKPSNILVDESGEPKVIDFGLAKAIDPDVTSGLTIFTDEGSWFGTPAYMAPEQFQAGSFELGERSDLYSLGVIFFELITGKTPFEVSSGEGKKGRMPTFVVPNPSKVAGEVVPVELEKILRKALREKPSERYSSVMEFCADLKRFQEGRRVLAGSGVKRRLIVGAACVLGLGLAGGLLFSNGQDEVEVSGEPPLVDVLHPIGGFATSPILNRDGSRVLTCFRNGNRALLVDAGSGEEIRSYSSVLGACCSAAFSPDGELFVIGDDGGSVRVFQSRNGDQLGESLDVTPGSELAVKRIAINEYRGELEIVVQTAGNFLLSGWSLAGEKTWETKLPELGWNLTCQLHGKRLVLGTKSGRLLLVDRETSNLVPIEEVHLSSSAGVRLLPDGSGFVSVDFSNHFAVCDWDGKVRHRWKGRGRAATFDVSPNGELVAVGNRDGVLRVWDLKNQSVVLECHHPDDLFGVSFSQDGKVLSGTCADRQIYLWEVESGERYREPWKLERWAWKAKFVPGPGEGNLVVSATKMGVRVISLATAFPK